MVYEGNEQYVFVSYAHKDSAKVVPILQTLNDAGVRLWFDIGIEAGTEWPEYIEDHLNRSTVVVVFMTPATVESRNCRNEINYALELQKEVLIVYLEETELLKGMRLQLNSTQSLFRKNHDSEESFIRELTSAKILWPCRRDGAPLVQTEREVRPSRVSDTRISNVCSIGTNDENDLWPKGMYSQVINRDEFSVVFFHMNLLKPIQFNGEAATKYQIYNEANALVFDLDSSVAVEAGYDKFSIGWIIKGDDGSFIPSGNYRFVCSIDHSPEFSYTFTVCGNAEQGKSRNGQSVASRIFGFLKDILG